MSKIKGFLCAMILLWGVTPALAQGDGANQLTYNGFSFSVDPALAAHINIVQVTGEPVNLETPGAPQAPYTEFILYNGQPAPETQFDAVGGIRLYPVASMAGYTEHLNRLQQLTDLLAEQPDLAAYMTTSQNLNDLMLPFLPILPAGQVIRARAQYVNVAGVKGISYITVYAQDVSPLLHDSFLYTFQGLDADGTYYVTATFWLDTSLFPTEISADFDWDTFLAGLDPYWADSIAALNSADSTDFTPSLAALDQIVQSFAFAP